MLVGDGKDYLADWLIRVFQCRISNAIENARFPGYPFKIVDIRGLDPAFGPRANAMHNLDQERDQGISHFLGALKHQSCQ